MTAIPVASPSAARRRLVGLIRRRWRGTLVVIALTAGTTAAAVAGPVLIGVVVDAATGNRRGGLDAIAGAAIGYAVLAVVSATLVRQARIAAAKVGEGALTELRDEVFDHAVRLPSEIVEQAGTGDLVSRVSGDVATLARAVRGTIPIAALATLELAATLAALLILDPMLGALALVAGALPLAVGGTWYGRHAPGRYREDRFRHATLRANIHNAYLGGEVLAAHRATGRALGSLVRMGSDVIESELSTAAARNRLRPSASIAQGSALVIVIAIGAAQVGEDALTIGTLTALALLIIRLFKPVSVLLEEADEIQQATASLARLVGVTQIPLHRPQAPGHGRRRPLGHVPAIEMRGIVAGYADGPPVLHDVTFDIQPGERIAIVGPSGAGKTTLARVVAGLSIPRSGAVRVEGANPSDLDGTKRVSLVAMVAQEGYVFGRSIADNVRLACPEASDADVEAALEVVAAMNWVRDMPQGIDTLVGQGHRPLRPSQVQQIGLARIVCADPKVVILDEATGQLDPAAAARTERHLRRALSGRTVVTIAHRLGVAATADRVVVMDRGRIVAQGAHSDLVAAGGVYSEMWASWIATRSND